MHKVSYFSGLNRWTKAVNTEDLCYGCLFVSPHLFPSATFYILRPDFSVHTVYAFSCLILNGILMRLIKIS